MTRFHPSPEESELGGAPVSAPARTTPTEFSLSRLLWLAFGYFIVAEISLTLASPPGFATPLWPAAGLAVGALLAWGLRCWPGVWLGSFAANIAHQAVIADANLAPTLFALSALIGTGASLQAVVAARLVRSFVHRADPLVFGRHMFYFLTLGGPLACLVSASIGVAGLRLLQGLPAEAAAEQWVVWWAGDSLGVLLLAPLIFMALPRTPKDWRAKNVLGTMVPLLLSGVLLVAGFVWHLTIEQAASRANIGDIADTLDRHIDDALTRALTGVLALASLFETSETVTSAGFHTFGRSTLAWSNLQSLAWIPKVRHEDRNAVERSARQHVEHNYTFLERDSENGLPVLAAERSEYYPIRYIASREAQSPVLGLDLGAHAASRAVLQGATDTAGLILAEQTTTLYSAYATQANKQAIFIAVYNAGFDAAGASPEARREALRGFVAGVLNLDQVVAGALERLGRPVVGVRILEVSSSDHMRLVLEHGVTPIHDASSEASRWINGVGGVELLLEIWPASPWSLTGLKDAQIYLVSSVIVSLFAALFALSAVGYGVRAAAEVSRRAAELRESEQRTRSLLDNTSTFIGELTPDGVLLDVNQATLTISGQRREDVVGKRLEDTYWFSHSSSVQAGVRDAIERARSGKSARYDVEARVGDDRLITVDFMLVPVIAADGRVVKLIPSGIDITDRKRIEDEIVALNQSLERTILERTAFLSRSERRFYSLFDHGPDAVLIIDARSNIRLINQHGTELFGYRPDELIGRQIEFLLPGFQRSAYIDLGETLPGPSIEHSVGPDRCFLARRRTGSTLPVELSLNPIELEEGTCMSIAVRDVSERMRLQAQSHRQHELLQTIVDNIPVMIAYFSANGDIQWVNKHWQKILGWSLAESQRPDILAKIYPDPCEQNRVLEFIAAATESWGDFKPRTKDGRIVDNAWANISLSDGSSIGFGLDLSERKESEKKFKKLLEATPDALVITDGDEMILLVNSQFERLLGYTRTELHGKPITELFRRRCSAESASHLERDYGNCGAQSMGNRNTIFCIHRNGTEIQVEITLSPLQTNDGIRIIRAIRDVTIRERTSQALRVYQSRLAHAQALAHLGYFSWDLDRDEMAWSEELFRIYGRDANDHRPSYDFMLECTHPDDRDCVRQEIEASMHEGRSFRVNQRIFRPSGEVRYITSFGEAVPDPSGRITVLFGACLDVSGQKKIESELNQLTVKLREMATKLVNAQEIERRRLAAELHDRVGQNLTALGINLAIMSRALSGASENIIDRLRESSALVELTAECVEGVLDELRPAMLEDIGLDAALRWYGETFGRRVEIKVDFNSLGTPRRVGNTCETALFRVAQEALNNVAKHAFAQNVEIVVEWCEDSLGLEIVDDGVGFDTGRRDLASGFGLITMSERVEAIGGRFELASAPGGGVRIAIAVRC